MFTPAQFVGLCFAGLCCLAPVSFYLCWLAGVNRRPHPTPVGGGWDFAGVFGALSGFLLAGGVLLLQFAARVPGLSQFVRRAGRADDDPAWSELSQRLFGIHWGAWLVLIVVYGGLVAAVLAVGVRKRRHWLSVYNLDADAAGRAVQAAVERAGLTATRTGDLWADARPLVEARTFHGAAHTTVRMLCPDPRVREELERHLRGELAATACEPGPAAAWFTSAAVGSVLLVVGTVGLIAWFVLTGR